MRFGVQLSTVREFTQTHKGFASTIKKLSEMGFDSVHVGSVNPVIPALEIAETCEAYDLNVISTYVNPMRIIEETELVIEESKAMGAKFVGINTMPNGYERKKAGFRTFITDFIPAARAIKEAELQFVYHNHHFEFEKFDGKLALDYLTEKFVDCNFALDLFWIQSGGCDPALTINKMAGRISMLHLKDYSIVEGMRRMTEVMEGNLNWKTIFQAAANAKVEYGMIEHDECYGKDPFECLRMSLHNIKNEYPNLGIITAG
ncbi:MAG: sugar phosphate isomerase/epimerase [Defluviitaleaceae bacterium]|nr:sugar phosphate isomerase/epimerase [Defluviitaleaceae bacterium]